MDYNEKTNKKDRKTITISLRQYYFFAIWLPVIFSPLLLLYSIDDIQTLDFSGSFSSSLFGIIQYIAFALWNIFKHRQANLDDLKQFAFKAPFSFVPFYAVGFIIIHIITNGNIPDLGFFAMLFSLSLLCIPVGYFYLLLSSVIQRSLEKVGFIHG